MRQVMKQRFANDSYLHLNRTLRKFADGKAGKVIRLHVELLIMLNATLSISSEIETENKT